MNQPQQPMPSMAPKQPLIAPWLLVTFIIVLLAAGGYLGYYYWNQSQTKTETPATTANATNNSFDPTKIKIGDTVAGMKVKSIMPFSDKFNDPAITKTPLSATNASVVFSGQIELNGDYKIYDNKTEDAMGILSGEVCFTPDTASQAKLPKMLEDGRDISWFCFTNKDIATSQLSTQKESNVKIAIDEYTINSYPSEVFDTAKLIQVVATTSTTASTNNQATLCTAEPITNDIGSTNYPIATKYQNIAFLGEFFTASDCGQNRLNKITGVNGDNYTLGSTIYLTANPTQGLVDTFKSLNFTCKDGKIDTQCLKWSFPGTIKVDNLLKLKPFVTEFKSDDCINCG